MMELDSSSDFGEFILTEKIQHIHMYNASILQIQILTVSVCFGISLKVAAIYNIGFSR